MLPFWYRSVASRGGAEGLLPVAARLELVAAAAHAQPKVDDVSPRERGGNGVRFFLFFSFFRFRCCRRLLPCHRVFFRSGGAGGTAAVVAVVARSRGTLAASSTPTLLQLL